MAAIRSVAETTVSSWASLLEELYRESWDPALQRHRSPFVYRGMPDAASDLRPSLMRLAGEREVARLEGHLLRNFRKYAHADSAAGDSIWNWLALAAHHGLPTRLLDWTYSPFVALHFATADMSQYGSDAVIWCVNHGETNRRLPKQLRKELDAEGSTVFTVDILNSVARSLQELETLSKEPFVVFLEPPSLDDRIVNQFALFSLMSTPTEAVDTWFAEHSDVSRRVIVPASLKWEVRDKLDQAGITERMLFPGLDGLTAWLTRYYTPHPSNGSLPTSHANARSTSSTDE
ncbi:MAG TPA: FRG domain-containing protein [Bryobacteraceae bacterium]|nr:FRG domain-containing protein [Bryobacteraceae bacterium]